MRWIGAGSLAYVLALAFAMSGVAHIDAQQVDVAASDHGGGGPKQDGRDIFRYDTFGDEQLWTRVLRMHEVLPTVSPATALSVGLKVDVEALPPAVLDAVRAN